MTATELYFIDTTEYLLHYFFAMPSTSTTGIPSPRSGLTPSSTSSTIAAPIRRFLMGKLMRYQDQDAGHASSCRPVTPPTPT